MVSVIDQITNVFVGLVEGIFHNLIGLGVLAAVVFFIWLKFGKPQPADLGKEIFKKEWEATTERLGLESPKKIGLCSYPMDVEELRKNPIHQIQYSLIGNVVGVNVMGARTSIERILSLSQKFTEKELADFLVQNQEAIDSNNLWIVFAIESSMGGRFLFKKTKKTLLHCKPNQIIDMNSKDDVIRLRGWGITPQGQSELVNDEQVTLNLYQLKLDRQKIIFDEIDLGTMSKMGDYVGKATKLDSGWRKETALQGVGMMSQPVSEEATT